MSKRCKSCDHYQLLSSSASSKCCTYILDTGKPRGCRPEECDKWTARIRKRKVTQDDIFSFEKLEV